LQLIIVISEKEDLAKEFIDRCKFILNRLPVWLYPQLVKDTESVLKFRHIDEKTGAPLYSEIKSLTTTEGGAQSKTPTRLILDEAARNRYLKSIWNWSKPGIDAAKGKIAVISNAVKDGISWWWVRDAISAIIKGEMDADMFFIPWHEHPNRGPDFIEQQIRENPQDDEDEIRWNYPETIDEFISAVRGSYFGKALARHTKTCPGIRGQLQRDRWHDLEFVQDPRGILEVWRFPYYHLADWDGVLWRNRYAIGADVAEGLGGNYSVAYVIDKFMDEIVARLRSNRLDAHEFGNALHNLSLHYDNALICCEWNGAGITTIKRLEALNANQYVKLVPGKVGSPVTKQLGWRQSEQGKHELCGDLKTFLNMMQGTLYCGILVDECSTFIRHEGGRLGSENESKNDDCVIAGGLTVQAMKFTGLAKKIQKKPTGWLEKWQAGKLED
jgi:hypothetical protein